LKPRFKLRLLQDMVQSASTFFLAHVCMYAASKSKRAIKQMKGNYHQENELLSPELFFWREKKIYMRRQYGKESFFNRTFRL
jgi:hypothetical protein